MAGSMMQNAAILWHVSLLVEPANRGLALGMVGLVRVVPIVTFSLVAGVIADARDRRRLMLFTQTGMAMAAALLSWIAFAGLKSVWPIHALAATGAAFGTFDNPGAIGVYGLATAVFGLSHVFVLSFVCLALTGAADTVSMLMRNLVRQLTTPDSMRGANDEREHDLLPGRTAAWRARGRARRERVGAGALRRVWWGRVSFDDRVGRVTHAAVASVPRVGSSQSGRRGARGRAVVMF